MMRLLTNDFRSFLVVIYLSLIDQSLAIYNATNNGFSLTNESFSFRRPSPPSLVEGTINWERLVSNGPAMFSPRHSHATCTFKCPHKANTDCIWLTGGRTELYRTFNLQMEDRTSDIWWSEDGKIWNKVMEVTGDFIQGIGNFDAKIGGEVAPWYSRYGHSLDAIDTDGDGIDDLMVLMGGFSPMPSNDIWISPNGTTWFYESNASWKERAYHATAVFKNRLWVMGGTPLNNEVWSGYFVKDPSQRGGYKIGWSLQTDEGKAPWAPRCAMCALVQTRKASHRQLDNDGNITNVVDSKPTDFLYLIGGFAGWPRNDSRWNGDRTRNDVWISEDGKTWNLVLPPKGQSTMPFTGRGWHACTTWHGSEDKKQGVKLLSVDEEAVNDRGPKLFLSGGGYMGTKGNSVVDTLEGYVDMWWSYDGSNWVRVNYEEGEKESLYSTNEWTSTLINNKYVFRGKWGHSLLSLPAQQDLNLDESISNSSTSLEFCSGTQLSIGQCKIFSVKEEQVPSLYIIGGDTTDGGPIVNDIFRSQPGVMCEQNGITCSNKGSCGPGSIGCICNGDGLLGEYCEEIDETILSNNSAHSKHEVFISIYVSLALVLFLF